MIIIEINHYKINQNINVNDNNSNNILDIAIVNSIRLLMYIQHVLPASSGLG